jgi:murein DD-endopeptidase MepM/ murein hydrolase activator NlpD
MARRLLLCLLLLPLAAPPASGDTWHRKREIDERISALNSKLATARTKEGVLTQQISVTTTKIRALTDDVRNAQGKLNRLEAQLSIHQDRLEELNTLFVLQTKKLNLLRRAYFVALERVETRLIDAYETPSVSSVDVMLSTTSFSNLLDELEYVNRIQSENKQVSNELFRARTEMHAIRERTRETKHAAIIETNAVRARVAEQHSVTAELVSAQQQLATARASKRDSLASVQESEREFLHEVEGLQAASQALGAKLRASASSGPSHVSSSGFIWPVNGPITSPFGWRWGRMHEGIDIGVGYGTPIHAAAAGTVVYCGWMSGYGNLVAIDHGGGISTAYGHQSSIAVGCGQTVGQGDVIGYVGCTGHCFGPHLHFEVRVNGTPVDPLGYL